MSQVELPESEYDEDDDDDDSQTSDPSEVEKAQESEGESEPINESTEPNTKSHTIDKDNTTSPRQHEHYQTNNPAEGGEVEGSENASNPTTTPETSPTKVTTPYENSLKREHVVPGLKDNLISSIPTLMQRPAPNTKTPQTMVPTVKLARQKLKSSREPSPATKVLPHPDQKTNPFRDPSPTNSKLLQLPTPQVKSGQGLTVLEQPLVLSIPPHNTYTQSDLKSYAVGIIKEGLVTYITNKDGVTKAILSDLVLKRCKDNYYSKQSDRKKVQQIERKLETIVLDKGIREEADKKGRTVSESDFAEDDQASQKASRLKSPPPN